MKNNYAKELKLCTTLLNKNDCLVIRIFERKKDFISFFSSVCISKKSIPLSKTIEETFFSSSFILHEDFLSNYRIIHYLYLLL